MPFFNLTTEPGTVLAVLPIAGLDAYPITLPFKRPSKRAELLLSCEATEDKIRNKGASSLVGLDLNLTTSGKLLLGIKFAGRVYIGDSCRSTR